MKRLIIYAGANGAGKSSLRAGGADPVDVEIDPDRIAQQMNPADPRSVDFAAGREALRLFDRTLAEGCSLSLETTLTGRTVLGRMQAAKDLGYDVTLRYVAVNDVTMNIRRVEGRAMQGGHWIEPDTIRRRVAGSLSNLPAAIVIADRAVLLDNSGSGHRQVLDIERTATEPNNFIHTGSGNDGIDVSRLAVGGGGTNVVDGGGSSNFVLLYGSGIGKGADTVFVDTRAAMADTWSTLVDFRWGDAVTIYGVTASAAMLDWEDNQGAAGSTGLTLHVIEQGKPIASLTLAGYPNYTKADLGNGRLGISFGSDPASGSRYLHIQGAGP